MFVFVSIVLILLFLILLYFLLFPSPLLFWTEPNSLFHSCLRFFLFFFPAPTYRKTDVETNDALVRLAVDVDDIVRWCVLRAYPTKTDAMRLERNWHRANVREIRPAPGDDIASVVDKGRELNICLTKPDGTPEDDNTMRFVVLHELAHMMSASYGHNDEFWRHFVDLLRVAVRLGKYRPDNYTIRPVNYCGTFVTQSPCDTASCFE